MNSKRLKVRNKGLRSNFIVKQIDHSVGAEEFKRVHNVETGEPEIIHPDEFESEAHVDVDVVNVLDYSFYDSDGHPIEINVVGWMSLNDEPKHPGGSEAMHEYVGSQFGNTLDVMDNLES